MSLKGLRVGCEDIETGFFEFPAIRLGRASPFSNECFRKWDGNVMRIGKLQVYPQDHCGSNAVKFALETCAGLFLRDFPLRKYPQPLCIIFLILRVCTCLDKIRNPSRDSYIKWNNTILRPEFLRLLQRLSNSWTGLRLPREIATSLRASPADEFDAQCGLLLQRWV